jgi:hypothetical protein
VEASRETEAYALRPGETMVLMAEGSLRLLKATTPLEVALLQLTPGRGVIPDS